MAAYIAPGNSTYRRVFNPLLELREKVFEIDENSRTSQYAVSVGSPTDKHSSIQDAIDAGFYNVVISSDLLVTSDVVVPRQCSLKIHILSGVTLTFSNAGFTRDPSLLLVATNMAQIVIVGAEGSTSGITPPNDVFYTSKLIMTYDTGQAGAVFDVDLLTLSNLWVEFQSPTVNGLQYIKDDTQTNLVDCYIVTNLGAHTVLCALKLGTLSTVERVQTEDSSSAPTWVWGCVGFSSFSSCSFTGTADTYVIFGETGSVGSTAVSSCKFFSVGIGAAQLCAWDSCFFFSVILTSTPGGTELSTKGSHFSNCTIFVTADLVISGRENHISEGQFTSPSGDVIISGNNNTLSNSLIQMATGQVTISGDENVVSGCTTNNGVQGGFVMVVDATAANTKLIGNAFSAALTDNAASTADIGNSSSV